MEKKGTPWFILTDTPLQRGALKGKPHGRCKGSGRLGTATPKTTTATTAAKPSYNDLVWVWVNNGYPKWLALVTGNKKYNLRSISWWFNFDPYPCLKQLLGMVVCGWWTERLPMLLYSLVAPPREIESHKQLAKKVTSQTNLGSAAGNTGVERMLARLTASLRDTGRIG